MKKKPAKRKGNAASKLKDAQIVAVFAPKHEQWTALRAEVRRRDGALVRIVQQNELQEEVFRSDRVAAFLEQVARVIRDENLL
jgi:hypothetical protein